ncbi:MAG: DUF5615 family PIN-like protein [Pirellulales bacterium]
MTVRQRRARAEGIDALSTPESGRLGASDESQLEWAANQERTLVSFNAADFAKLRARWLTLGRHHAGVVVSTQRKPGDLLRRLVRLAESLDAEAMNDRLEFLSDW